MILGITGGVGAGKSTVLSYLHEKYTAFLIECDALGKELQEPDGACFPALAALLGPFGCVRDGVLDRTRMAQVLFADPDLMADVNAIVHPAVMDRVRELIDQNLDRYPLIVIESALLIQAGYRPVCDAVWYIHADPEVRAQRLMVSRGYSKERIAQMFASQPEEFYFREHSDLTIDNSSEDVQNTYEQIDRGIIQNGVLQYSKREQR